MLFAVSAVEAGLQKLYQSVELAYYLRSTVRMLEKWLICLYILTVAWPAVAVILQSFKNLFIDGLVKIVNEFFAQQN